MNKTKIALLSILALLTALPSFAQRHTVEYFWNTDPGINKAKKVSGNLGDGNNLEVSLDADGLQPGIHTLGMRVYNGKRWSTTVRRFVFVPMGAGAITSALCEYYWDSDPGVGSGRQLSVSTNGVGEINLSLAAEGLAPGLHRLGMRTKINGRWSSTVNALVFVKDPSLNKIDALEYFWGSDPGVGNGTKVDIAGSGDEAIVNLTLDMPQDEQDSYLLTIRAHSAAGGWSTSYQKTLSAYALGDSNGSGEVTVTDIATTVDYILGGTPPKFVFQSADVTRDESITLADAVGTLNIILGIADTHNAPRRIMEHSIGETALCFSADGKGIALCNAAAMSALQFDLLLPEELSLAESAFALTDRCDASHTVAYRRMDDGAYRVLLYSMSNSALEGNSGEVLRLALVSTTDNLAGKTLQIKNAYAVEANATEHLLGESEFELTGATGIAMADCAAPMVYASEKTINIISPYDTKMQLVTMGGMRRMLNVVKGHNRFEVKSGGVYLIDGQKIVVK